MNEKPYARTLADHLSLGLPVVSGLTRCRARFKPSRTDTLRPEWLQFIGRETEWRCCGTVESGPFAGQRIWDTIEPDWPDHWIPEQDLEASA